MSGVDFFVRPCPACRRRSKIALAYLGKLVRCHHCRHVLRAEDEDGQSASLRDPVDLWIRFTDQANVTACDIHFEPSRHPR